MSLWRKKTVSPIDRRLQELAQELEQVRGEARGVAQQAPPAPSTASSAPPPEPRAGAPVRPLAPTLADDDLFAHAARSGATTVGGPAASAARPNGSGKPAWLQSSREKFANYFMAGHFQNLRPLRQESRVLRNKAIMMLLLLLAALGWFYYIWRH